MKRQNKYPDTNTFHYHNANPKNRLTNDCVIRAISIACEKDYNEVVMDLAKLQCETGYDGCSKHGIELIMKYYGWIKMKQPRKYDNTKYTGKEFCIKLQNDNDNKRLVANIGGHHIVAILEGKIWDTWDSSDNCIGNYWIKE